MRKFGDSLVGHMFSVILTAFSAAGIVYLVIRSSPDMNSPTMRWILIILMGAVTGITSRILLAGNLFMLQWLTAALGLLGGLILLGFLSQGEAGTMLYEIGADRRNLSWAGELSAASAGALIPILIIKSPKRVKDNRKTVPVRSEPGGRTANSGFKSQKPAPPAKRAAKNPQASQILREFPFLKSDYWSKRGKKLQKKMKEWWKNGLPEYHFPPEGQPESQKRKSAVRVNLKRQPFKRTRPKQTGVQSSVHLIGKEEHRCPYCLEIVEPRDPRGVEICPICRTHHHADCWAVTGTCQVPHFHQ